MSEEDNNQDFISKSQLKREAKAIRDVGAELVALKPIQLAAIPLDEEILDAIAFAKTITSNVARKRQMQYLAKLMRRVDMEPIIAALDAPRQQARQLTASQHRIEAWRDRLIEEGDGALQALLATRDDINIQSIRQLMRNANKEAKLGKPPASSRSLFRYLRELDQQQTLPAATV